MHYTWQLETGCVQMRLFFSSVPDVISRRWERHLGKIEKEISRTEMCGSFPNPQQVGWPDWRRRSLGLDEMNRSWGEVPAWEVSPDHLTWPVNNLKRKKKESVHGSKTCRNSWSLLTGESFRAYWKSSQDFFPFISVCPNELMYLKTQVTK